MLQPVADQHTKLSEPLNPIGLEVGIRFESAHKLGNDAAGCRHHAKTVVAMAERRVQIFMSGHGCNTGQTIR